MPRDEIAAGVGDTSRLAALQADREQVLDALKAAFVQGRLAKDEFDLRVGRMLAIYAELDVLTADLPAGPGAAQPPEPAPKSHNKRLIQRGTAAGTGASVALVAVVAVAARGNPVLSVIIVSVFGCVMALLLTGLLTGISWVLEQGTGRQRSQGPPLDPRGMASQRLTSAEPAEPPSQVGPDTPHTTEAAQSRSPLLPVRRSRSPQRWRTAYGSSCHAGSG